MYLVGFVEDETFIKSFDKNGFVTTLDHTQAVCFQTEIAAWNMVLVCSDLCCYDMDQFFVEFFECEV